MNQRVKTPDHIKKLFRAFSVSYYKRIKGLKPFKSVAVKPTNGTLSKIYSDNMMLYHPNELMGVLSLTWRHYKEDHLMILVPDYKSYWLPLCDPESIDLLNAIVEDWLTGRQSTILEVLLDESKY